MLSREQRTAILELSKKGCGIRQIRDALGISRRAIREVIRSQDPEPPRILRPRKAEPYRQEILELYSRCKGNLARVHEELLAQGAEISYPALTDFCREQEISRKPKIPAGRYHFEPGQELQHDTSPHKVVIGGKPRTIQTATAVLCHSRMIFLQSYARFRRFECKSFLSEALRFFDGVPEVVMIDNTHVVVLRGTGAQMVPVPEMESFSQRFGFTFRAHEIGDVNRSAHAERSFDHYERNFLVGRTFTDLRDLNQKARAWCEAKNASFKRHLKARPIELFALERTRLRPLPAHVPEPYQLHQRIVDVEGYVTIDTHRYSVPPDWIRRRVQVRETQETIEIETASARTPVRHQRVLDPQGGKTTLPAHKIRRGQGRKRRQPGREEAILQKIAPELGPYIEQLKRHGKKKTTLALRQLLRMVREYPRESLLGAVERARCYGLYDLDRVERLVIRHTAGEYFQLHPDGDEND